MVVVVFLSLNAARLLSLSLEPKKAEKVEQKSDEKKQERKAD